MVSEATRLAAKARRKKIKEIVKEIKIKKRAITFNKQRITMIESQLMGLDQDGGESELLMELELIKLKNLLDELDISRYDHALMFLQDEKQLMRDLFQYKYIDELNMVAIEMKIGYGRTQIYRILNEAEKLFIKVIEL